MAKNTATKNAAAAVKNVADVAAVVADNNTNNTNNTAAAPERMNAADVVALSASLIKQYGTMSAIRDKYAELCAMYGKDNVKDVIKNAGTIRATEIKNAADKLNADVFTFHGITSAVFAAVRRSAGYTALCGYAKRVYNGTDAETAARVIADYYTAVDASGAPLSRVSYVSADATQIVAAYAVKTLTFSNAVGILKTALDGMKTAATNAATRQNGRDNVAVVRDNVRVVGRVVAVYAAAADETGRVSVGQRRDNNSDAKTRERAAAYIGAPVPVGYVPVVTYNAAMNGNEDAAAAVEDARNAAKDAAAAAGHAAAV